MINVLSLFNGMNTGRQALYNCGFKIGKYYSSEIKKNAIKLTQHHFPDTIQVGNINNWQSWDIDWKDIDIILSGSPCQDLSIMGNQKGITGEKSKLFFIFIDILNYIRRLNPDVIFLQENVGSANKYDIGVMSRLMGVYPVRINSSLVTAQLRDRYYWTNIKTRETLFDMVTDIPLPKNRHIKFMDIVTDEPGDEKYIKFYQKNYPGLIEIENGLLKINEAFKTYYVSPGNCIDMSYPGNRSRSRSRSRSKSSCLLSKNYIFTFDGENIRPINKIELCRLQGFHDNYCDILTRNHAAGLLGDGWTLPIIEHIFSFLSLPK